MQISVNIAVQGCVVLFRMQCPYLKGMLINFPANQFYLKFIPFLFASYAFHLGRDDHDSVCDEVFRRHASYDQRNIIDLFLQLSVV